MKTMNDLWKYICKHGNAREFAQFYVSNPNEVAKAFWNGVLTVLEIEGKITREEANLIWSDIIS